MAKNTYLRWEAESMKAAITQNLVNQGIFTDQIFQDSNLSTFIDVFSYMFETLSYYNNHGASEAISSDTKLFENMNRIVKMLGYNPSGYFNANLSCTLAVSQPSVLGSNAQYILPKYTTFNSKLKDTRGKEIQFSLISEKVIITGDNGVITSSVKETQRFVNGSWKIYPSVLVSSGIPLETFVLDKIVLNNADKNKINYVSHPYIDIWIKRAGTMIQYDTVSQGNLFSNNNRIFNNKDNVVELRINEDYNYTLTFGDGLHGSKLLNGDEIYIVYLEGNGPDVKIVNNLFNDKNKCFLSINKINGATTEFMDSILPSSSSFPPSNANIYVKNIADSTAFVDLETVDEIRFNAPDWFRSGNRLITKRDFEIYLESGAYKNTIADVKCMNNWEYMNEFLHWLHLYKKLDVNIRALDYAYADSCDFNNVYLWLKYKTSSVEPNLIIDDLQSKKCLTAEPIIYEALPVTFVPCFIASDNTDKPLDLIEWDTNNIKNFIDIKKSKNSLVSAEKIKDLVANEILKFFDDSKLKLGQFIDINSLTNKILSLDGVESVKTTFEGTNYIKEYQGLSFIMFTRSLVDGADMDRVTGSVKLRNFQYAKLLETDALALQNRIRVSYSGFTTATIEY